jgi:hypothetical protein
MKKRMRSLFQRASRRRADILFVMLWSLVFSVIVIKIYLVAYIENLRLSYFQIPFASYGGPAPDILDMLIIAVISLIGGFVLRDVKEMLYGYVVAVSLSFIVGVTFVSFYIWSPLGWGELFSLGAYDWEWAVLMAIWGVFRIMFPLLVAVSLASVVIGAFTKELMA